MLDRLRVVHARHNVQRVRHDADAAHIVLHAAVGAGTFLTRDRWAGEQLAPVYAAFLERAIVRVVRRGQHQLVLGKREIVHRFRFAHCTDEAQRDLAVQKHAVHARAVTAAQRVAEIFLPLQIVCKIFRQQILPGDRGCAEGDSAGVGRVCGKERMQCAAVCKDALCDRIDLLSGFGQPELAAAAAYKKLTPERMLQLADVSADGGLVEKKLLRRARKAAVLHDRGKDLQLLETDVVHPPFPPFSARGFWKE